MKDDDYYPVCDDGDDCGGSDAVASSTNHRPENYSTSPLERTVKRLEMTLAACLPIYFENYTTFFRNYFLFFMKDFSRFHNIFSQLFSFHTKFSIFPILDRKIFAKIVRKVSYFRTGTGRACNGM